MCRAKISAHARLDPTFLPPFLHSFHLAAPPPRRLAKLLGSFPILGGRIGCIVYSDLSRKRPLGILQASRVHTLRVMTPVGVEIRLCPGKATPRER